MQLTLNAPVRFPEARIKDFAHDTLSDNFQTRNAGLHSPVDSELPTAYIFRNFSSYSLKRFTIIKVGRCTQQDSSVNGGRPVIWATVSAGRTGGTEVESEEMISKISADPRHDCLQDHVLQWPALERTTRFGWHKSEVTEVTLTFAPCPLNPEQTLILDAFSQTV